MVENPEYEFVLNIEVPHVVQLGSSCYPSSKSPQNCKKASAEGAGEKVGGVELLAAEWA